MLSRYFIVKDLLGVDLQCTHLLVPSLSHSFQVESLLLAGISGSRCINATRTNHVKASQLVVTSHPNPEPHDNQGWIINRLREEYSPKGDAPPLNPSFRFVYISRSDAAHRRLLVNEDELLHALEPFGVYRCLLSRLSFQQQIGLFAQARVIIGVHGAGLANLTFAAPGAIVFELLSEYYRPRMYEYIARHNGLDYNGILCHASTAHEARVADIHISSHHIQSIVQRLSLLL